jgi:hypothetical protein
VGLFVLSAVVPLTLCALLLYGEFSSKLQDSSRQPLDGVLRNFGTTLLGRLGGADDAVKILISASGTSAAAIETNASQLQWVVGARIAAPFTPLDAGAHPPTLDARQIHALAKDASIVVWTDGEDGPVRIYLIHALPSGDWLSAEITQAWLWADARDFAGESLLELQDNNGHVLAATESQSDRPAASAPRLVRVKRMSRSWEIFLASRFSSPSWRLVVTGEVPTLLSAGNRSYLIVCGLIAFTILLITWLSLSTSGNNCSRWIC